MRNKRYCERYGSAGVLDAVGRNNEAVNGYKNPQDLVEYYKSKAVRLEREFDNLTEILESIRSVCDLSHDLQTELNQRNEEVSKLQQVVSDLQIHLFREKEHCLKLSAENDRLQIQEFEDRKKINTLLMLTGAPDCEMLHVLSTHAKGIYVEKKLPPKLQKLREMKRSKVASNTCVKSVNKCEDMDPQTLILKNQSLAAQLEHHISISREQIQVLLKDRELAIEEREIERLRLQKQIDLLTSKLKETQDNLYEASLKLTKCQQSFEKERNHWMEEKEKYLRMLKVFKDKNHEKFPDIPGYAVSGVGCSKRHCSKEDVLKELMQEKEQLAASYQEQIIAMEAEINSLKERAQACRKIFKEKIDQMTAQSAYLKKKYEDLDRRRQLEAEGFRTDIRMLRERLKDLEKKLAKANICSGTQPSEQQLLVSARNTLNRARQLEKELTNMKSKISIISGNECS